MTALAGAEMSMRDVGIDVVPGSGVAAAQEFYRQNAPKMAMAAE
ncbi:MAG: serine--glyoxylate aminotransferase, partial [Rhodobacteraceae bacterium]|nr:serine--glyoxylate aminotransferase [Paracoccaceae bacterium]